LAEGAILEDKRLGLAMRAAQLAFAEAGLTISLGVASNGGAQ